MNRRTAEREVGRRIQEAFDDAGVPTDGIDLSALVHTPNPLNPLYLTLTL